MLPLFKNFELKEINFVCVLGIMDFRVTSFFAKAGGINRLENWVRGERILAKVISCDIG